MTEASASFSRRLSGGYTLTPSSDTLDGDTQGRRPSKGDRALRYWCFSLHVFLVVLHIVLVGMLFTHPEHRFTVSVNNTTATLALKAFLQGFYSIYIAVLVLVTRRLAISATMWKRQTLTAVHDVSGAWNGIGAAINVLWQQTKLMSAPSAILLTLVYLGCISGLHIISSSVIRFEAFNNTITSSVPSTLAWPSPSVNLSDLTWGTISPLLTLWPLFSTAKGMSGSTLYDVPSSGYTYAGAVVEATTLTADCGLLSNLSVGTLNTTLKDIFSVRVSGLGEVAIPISEDLNSVFFISLPGSESKTANNSYIGYQAATLMELGNLSHEVAQVTTNSSAQSLETSNSISITSYFVACTLNATSDNVYLPMQNGKAAQNISQSVVSQPDSWTLWSPGPTTNLTRLFNIAQDGLSGVTSYSNGPELCQEVTYPPIYGECGYMSMADVYINNLLGVGWLWELKEGTSNMEPLPPITLGQQEMENVVAQLAATFIWLAGTAGAESGGFQQAQGKSLISNTILELRLNVNITPVVVGLIFSVILSAVVVWMFYGFHPTPFKTSVTSSGFLELIWISAHSTILQESMKSANSSIPDQLRLRGMKVELCLANMASKPVTCQEDHTQPNFDVNSLHQQRPLTKGKPAYSLCYALHIILLALHVALIVLLKYHPEHIVTMASDNPWVTITLSVCLQTFYTLYTAGLVFFTQQLAMSTMVRQQHYLTTVHDVSQAWIDIGAAVCILWQQIKVVSSIWAILGVTTYLACVSILHIASSTIMQFTAFNSASVIPIQSTVTWPNNTVITTGSWIGPNKIVPPSNLLQNMDTPGLFNSTIYDIVNTTGSTLTTAIVNATSLQANCGLLSNLTFSNSGNLSTFNFSVDGLGSGMLYGTEAFQSARNQVAFLTYHSSIVSATGCSLCDQYMFFLITTNINLDQSIAKNTQNLDVNIAKAGSSAIIGYVAACSLLPQAGYRTLDLQSGTLISAPTQTSSQSWKLWSAGNTGSSHLIGTIRSIYDSTAFGICPQNGFVGCSMWNASLPEQNSSLYTVTPDQVQQAIENSVAAMIWIAGRIGSSQGGFDWTIGESQVTQVITEWRLNINQVPVVFASAASLMLLVIISLFIGLPPRAMQPHATVTSISVLETLWMAAHSWTLCKHMVEVNEPSLNDLRKAGMLKMCLGDI